MIITIIGNFLIVKIGYLNAIINTGISEYGYGANVNQHEEFPVRGNPGVYPEGQWHPIEYQNQQHELAVKEVTDPARNGIWCAYIWNMFDFASDFRNEGSQPGMNDKGLVSYDRTYKKDVFYLYKANWNKKDKFIHLTSAEFSERVTSTTYVKAYSNLQKLALYINGILISELENDGNGIFKWDNVHLNNGQNEIMVKALDEGYKHLTEKVNWNKSVSNNTMIKSSTFAIDSTTKTILVKNNTIVSDVVNEITSNYGATFTIYQADGKTQVTSGLVKPGMKLVVTAENKTTKDTYTFNAAYLSTYKSVWASSNETGNVGENVVDNNPNSRWAASSSNYPQTLIIDLGGRFILNDITVNWYISGDRTYKYNLYIGDTNGNYTLAIDHTKNTTVGTVTDSLDGYSGRYIKIEVTGCSSATGYASIYEIIVNGWGINSSKYNVDEGDKTIKITTTQDIAMDEFLKYLGCEGDCDIIINTAKNTISNGDTITFVDKKGISHTYTIIFN